MSAKGEKPARILHVHSTFASGGKELRSVRIMNALGKQAQHTIVSADPSQLAAKAHIARGVKASFLADFPSLRGRPTPGRLNRIARTMKPFDLVLTYNWGAMDAVMAHTLFRDHLGLPSLVHHEDGFNEDERDGLKTTRNWYRRIALGKASGLVVPSETLEEIALETWQQPLGRVKRIANGIDTRAFAKKPKPDALRGVIKRREERWVGTLAGLRRVKNLPALVRAFRTLPEPWQLVIVGEGPEEAVIRDEANRLNIGHRVHLPGFVPDPARFVGLFDIFALSSDTEQFPISVVEAMAAGLPVVAPDVGDVAEMVAPANTPFVIPAGDDSAIASALERLAADDALRKAVGEENRQRAVAEYDERRMLDTYRRLYGSAMGRTLT